MKLINASEYIVPIVDIVPTDNQKAIKSLEFLGSGFFISKGWLLTCRHVIDRAENTPCAVYRAVGDPNERTYDGLKGIEIHPFADIALARVGETASESYKHFEVDLESERIIGADIVNYSYVEDIREGYQAAATPRLFKGHIMRSSTEQADSRIKYLEVSFPALAGMSGSPIIDQNSVRVVGLLYQNFRSQILEDYLEVIEDREKETTVSSKQSLYKVVEYAKALDLAALRDFLEPALAEAPMRRLTTRWSGPCLGARSRCVSICRPAQLEAVKSIYDH